MKVQNEVMENVKNILSNALKNLADQEVVAINAGTAREIGLEVEAGTPDGRPVEFSVSEIRAKLNPAIPVSATVNRFRGNDGADV